MKKHILIIFISIVSIFNLFSQKVIEMEQENGVYYVPCKVNGVPMKFVFDTGASDVSISLTEAKFLIKQGLLKDIDIKKSVKYQIANGDIQEGTKIILREINIDGIIINDVEASIIHNLEAPLLLGQSAISKLGRIKLDGNQLIIDSENNNEDYTRFLNIDVRKPYIDYGFPYSLDKMPVNEDGIIDVAFPLKLLKKDNKHFLEDFNFENEIVRFKKNGLLRAILLSKKSKNINIEFYKLSERIRSVYGVCTEYGNRTKVWKKPYYEIAILKNEEGILTVIIDVKQNKSILKKELRVNWLKMINDYYTSSDKNHKSRVRFARTEGNNIAIYIQFDLETNMNYFKKSGQEEEIINILCYSASSVILENEKFNKTLINELKYENIVLNVELTYYGINRFKSTKYIRGLDIKKLRVPFTEGELMDIIN